MENINFIVNIFQILQMGYLILILWGHGSKFPDWALAPFKYIEWTEEEQVIIRGPNFKI